MEEQNAAILSWRLFPSLQAMRLSTTLTGTEKSTQPPMSLTVSKRESENNHPASSEQGWFVDRLSGHCIMIPIQL